MNRREWLKRASLVAAGTVAADQLELLDRLGWVRRLFPSAAVKPAVFPLCPRPFVYKTFDLGFTISREMVEDDLMYGQAVEQMQRQFADVSARKLAEFVNGPRIYPFVPAANTLLPIIEGDYEARLD